jgi:hypothetical protein
MLIVDRKSYLVNKKIRPLPTLAGRRRPGKTTIDYRGKAGFYRAY